MLKIFIDDMNLVNNGESNGRWVSLPMAEDELQEVINNIADDEYIISDIDCDNSLIEFVEYKSAFSYNDEAKMFEELNKEQILVAEVVINEFFGDIDDALYYAEGGKYTIYVNEFELVDSLNVDETEYDSFEELMDDILSENTNLLPLNDGRYLELHRSCLIHF